MKTDHTNNDRTDRLSRALVPCIAIILLLLFRTSSNAQPVLQEAQVIKAHDGDTVTLQIKGKFIKVRLIGIDAPEMGQRPWGKRSKEHLIDILNHTDWTVLVETDVVKQDKFGRTLAYLWTKNKQLINELMVRDGYAVLFTIAPNVKFVERFKRAEQQARQDRKGLWESKGLKERPADWRTKHPRK